MKVPLIERVLTRLQEDPVTGCWLWLGALTNGGYGLVKDGNRKMVLVHRAVYAHYKGLIPLGLNLDHKCRVRRCCNPDHTHPVTKAVNTLENSHSLPALNAQKTHCPKCGGDYYKKRNGRRHCRPCDLYRDNAARRLKQTTTT